MDAKETAKNILGSPMTLGILLTFVFLGLAWNYYDLVDRLEGERLLFPRWRQELFSWVEWPNLKNMDARLRLRQTTRVAPNVALVAIDDRAVEDIGRWPWSREKIAQVVDQLKNNGAKAVGFDIIFSEAQTSRPDPAVDPDVLLTNSLSQFKDHVVLGTFSEDANSSRHSPYQDYCRNEAFHRANADQFVKLNTTFIVNDEADPFVDLPFEKVLTPIFADLEQKTTQSALHSLFGKPDEQSLNEYEQSRLRYLKETENMNYCRHWLTKDDPYLIPETRTIYESIFAGSSLLKGYPFEQALQIFKSAVKPLPIVQYERWKINIPLMQNVVDYTGSFNVDQDSDGTIRRASLFYRTGNRIGLSFIPSLALQTYLLSTGYRAMVEINLDPKHPEQKKITQFNIVDPNQDPEKLIAKVPVDPQGRLLINYAGGANMYPTLSARELFNNKETAEIQQAVYDTKSRQWLIQTSIVKKADFIKDRTFIFGATAVGIYDLRVTPFEKNFPGPEIHTNILGNLFQKNFLHTSPNEFPQMMLALLVFGILLSVAISQFSAIPGFLVTLGSLLGVGALDQLFLRQGIIVTMVLPAGLIIFEYIFLFFFKYLTEERKKKYLRSTFSKYVSPAIVDEILKHPKNIELGGKKQHMTVFFSDVRGFTTISEKLDPQKLSEVLNRYLTPMTQIVFSNNGTLDKYMGDAVMAFFGAPISDPHHAKYACRCALQSLAELKKIQKQFAAEGLPEIDIGIGINTGDMSVGNMGSDIVRNYTIMGDAVNLGSRLEGINKEYGTRIIISQFTYEEVKNSFTCREIDRVRVKGKLEPVHIYELICEGKPTEEKRHLLQAFSEGFSLYHQRKFIEALERFQKCLSLDPQDSPSALYVNRCQEYMLSPPPPEWDGVYVMKTK
jgi:adenylate cyclase